jgi:hypothetical protein
VWPCSVGLGTLAAVARLRAADQGQYKAPSTTAGPLQNRSGATNRAYGLISNYPQHFAGRRHSGGASATLRTKTTNRSFRTQDQKYLMSFTAERQTAGLTFRVAQILAIRFPCDLTSANIALAVPLRGC